WHQVHLVGGEAILGSVTKLDASHLHVRTVWMESLAIPRVSIERVTNAPDARPILFDAFNGDLSAWTTAGQPRLNPGRLPLNRPGQSIEAKLKHALPSGRAAVGFESAQLSARRCLLELDFERDGKSNV